MAHWQMVFALVLSKNSAIANGEETKTIIRRLTKALLRDRPHQFKYRDGITPVKPLLTGLGQNLSGVAIQVWTKLEKTELYSEIIKITEYILGSRVEFEIALQLYLPLDD